MLPMYQNECVINVSFTPSQQLFFSYAMARKRYFSGVKHHNTNRILNGLFRNTGFSIRLIRINTI
jgi:hypothetical protein